MQGVNVSSFEKVYRSEMCMESKRELLIILLSIHKPKSREACVWEKILSRDMDPSSIANFIHNSELPGKFSFTFEEF